MTNYEKIIGKTLDEMEQFLNDTSPCDFCIYSTDNDNCARHKCKVGVTAWLNQEVTDND